MRSVRLLLLWPHLLAMPGVHDALSYGCRWATSDVGELTARMHLLFRVLEFAGSSTLVKKFVVLRCIEPGGRRRNNGDPSPCIVSSLGRNDNNR